MKPYPQYDEKLQLIEMPFDPKAAAAYSIAQLDRLRTENHIERVVVGLSGGNDSATSFVLAWHVFGKRNIHIMYLPDDGMIQFQGAKDAGQLAKKFGIPPENQKYLDIKRTVDTMVYEAGADTPLRRGNFAARARMSYLMDMASQLNNPPNHIAVVLGTENRTEHLLGYFTIGGDNVSIIEPIQWLYKTQVWQMAKALDVPDEIIAKAPSADLWADQTDEGELGFSYQMADQILYLYVDQKKTLSEINMLGFDPKTVMAVVQRMNETEFKRKIPYVLPPPPRSK